MTDETEERLWPEVHDARQRCFECVLGPLSGDILTMLNMTGVWPGGGLYIIPASRIGGDVWLYTTFGLSDHDMPTGIALTKTEFADGKVDAALEKREPAARADGAAGYGHEILLATRGKQDWPTGCLQWAVSAEIVHDAGMLGRIERHDGLAVAEIDVGAARMVDVLIHKAQPPLPTGGALPNARMTVLAATLITKDEMRWTFDHGRTALLAKLREAGVGQLRALDRKSVVG
jgi:hypothetical protein